MAPSNFTLDAINTILLQREHKLLVDTSFSTTVDNQQIVLTILKNIEDLGFVFSQELFDVLRFQSEGFLVGLYPTLVRALTMMLGAHVKHRPFYQNFPQQMGSLTELDIFMNAIVHYWTNGKWQPEYVGISRLPLQDAQPKTRMIGIGTLSDFHQIFTRMMQSKGSLSVTDQALLGWYLKTANADELQVGMPDVIPSKEILGLLVASLLKAHPDRVDLVERQVKTATDVLRIATSLSGGDISLADNTRYRSFSRSERRYLLDLLNRCNQLEEDVGRYPGKWKRLGEKLHPGDYAEQYPLAYGVFTKIRNGEKLYSFASDVESAIRQSDLARVLTLLGERPGVFGRRLDFLTRCFPADLEQITTRFAIVADQISSPVLLQLIAHFKHRNIEIPTRSFFPKGNVAKVQVVENSLPILPASFCHRVVQICEDALRARFKSKSPLGKVYVDPILKDIVVPLAQRSASRTLKTFARGSQFDLDDQVRVLRAFIHWKNITIEGETPKLPKEALDLDDSLTGDETPLIEPIQDWRAMVEPIEAFNGPMDASEAGNPELMRQIRTDVDLSLGLYDAEWNYLEHISYTNIRSQDFEGLYHSGDIVDAPEGASEFIDLDIPSLLENHVRYAVFNVYSYTRQGFNEIPECFFGWMAREEIDSGEIFEPKTVVNKIDLASPTTICLPVVFDLDQRTATWMDISLRSNPNWVNNFEANWNNVVLISKAMLEIPKPKLFDLLMLNVQARGEVVDDPKQADRTFGLDESDDLTPFQVERILADFM
ncbi:MAG: hypothetical protein K0B06_06175 [Brevefilum sp.]|nr:hypothetical protein [Brevefilum sp.]